MLKILANLLLDLLFPKYCLGCGRWGRYFCDACLAKIEYFDIQVCPYCEKPSLYGFTHPRCARPLGLDGMFVLAHYRGPIRRAIKKIKYRRTFAICEELGRLVAEKYPDRYEFNYLVPVPLHWWRKMRRGFNQAEKLASALARIMNYELRIKGPGKSLQVISPIQRTRETKPQFGLKYDDRKKNVRDAFAFIHNSRFMIHNSAVCLVDDVATTGATIFECAKVLKRAGAKKVYAICAARGG